MDVESNKIGSSLVFEADCGSEGSESMAEMDPSGRTKKRFRDSRPNEGIIHGACSEEESILRIISLLYYQDRKLILYHVERTLQKLFSAQRTASTDVSQLPDDDQMNEEIGSQHTSQYISSSAAPELPRQTSTLDAFLGINRSQSTDHDSNNIHAHDINSGKIKRPPMHRLAPFAAPATHLSSLTPTSNTEASHPTFSFSSSSSLSTSLLPSSSAYSAFQLPPTQPSLPSFFLPTPTQTPPPNHKTLDQYGFASAIAANAAATMAPVDGDSDTGMADVDVDAGFGVALSCSSSMDVEIGNGEMAMG